MDHGTLFYIIGPLLAASAVAVTIIGLKLKDFPGRAAPLIFIWFAVLVGASTTLAVLHSQDEEVKKEQEHHLEQATESSEEAEQQ